MHQLKDIEVSFVVGGKLRVFLKNTIFNDLTIEIQDLLNNHVDMVVDDFPNE